MPAVETSPGRWEIAQGPRQWHELSRFEQIISSIPVEDRTLVALDANATLNRSPGYRPSDAAREVVAAYQRQGAESFRREFHESRRNSAAYPQHR